MKTKSILLILFLAFSISAEYANAQVKFGLRNGVAASTFSQKGNLANNDKVVFSYLSGMFLTLPMNNSFAIQPELNYLKKGRSNEQDILGISTNTDYMLNYLQVPVQLQYRNANISKSGKSVFYFNAGPYAAFNLDNEKRISTGNTTTILVTKDDKKTDWGLVLGLGFQTPVLKRDIRFDLKYDIGETSINGQPDDYKTKCLSLTVGIVL